MSSSSLVKRHRGAQPGNLNALKHGFYTSRFNRAELTAINNLDPASLKDEIIFLRLLTRRLIDQASDELTFQQRYAAMRVYCLACLTLTRMFKVQQMLTRGQDPFSQAINVALEQVRLDLCLDDVAASEPPNK